jgi:hypothetical protein
MSLSPLLAITLVAELTVASAPIHARANPARPRLQAKAQRLERLTKELHGLGQSELEIARRLAIKEEMLPLMRRQRGLAKATVSASLGKDYPGDPGRSVVVVRAGHGSEHYMRTNRGVDEYRYGFDARTMKGKRVLDLGTGNGRFVRQARKLGVLAEGVDLVLTRAQKRSPYFHEVDATDTGLPSASYDQIVSCASLFSYESNNVRLMSKAFAEVHRLLKPGGRITLMDGYPNSAFFSNLRGFRIVKRGINDLIFIVLEKT